MNEGEARRLAAALSAAYPRAMPDATFRLYLAELARLEDAQIAGEAIAELVRAVEWLPTVAAIREAYGRRSRRAADEAARLARARALPAGERPPLPAVVREFLERLNARPARRTA